ncbi:hypothetical protein MLD38_001229 [Melastoma candidum]|uniref:Uncharacterized protein n=1 Tax=Melastoma candidum TaxID=119954 RepID=A0ACB9SD06_9MYRT|nr:hypothetical protein MLD38_001229 [Melastoma candidum]
MSLGEYHLDLIVSYGAVPAIVPRDDGADLLGGHRMEAPGDGQQRSLFRGTRMMTCRAAGLTKNLSAPPIGGLQWGQQTSLFLVMIFVLFFSHIDMESIRSTFLVLTPP